MKKHTIRFCPNCGSGDIQFGTPSGDNRERYHCPSCGYIQYFNPIPVVGTILSWEGKILLCQRGIEPRKHLWTYPAGFMELNESVVVGAERETHEEALAAGDQLRLFAMFSLHREGQVHITYRGRLRDGKAEPGDESLQTKLFAPEEIRWQELAFPVIHETLRLYLEDYRRGEFGVHQGSIHTNADGSWETKLEPIR